MKKILKIASPNDYAEYLNAPVFHKDISIVHYDEMGAIHTSLNNYGVYGLFIQREFPRSLTYGMKRLEVSDGSILAVAPGQHGGKEDDGSTINISGWVLLWSADFLDGGVDLQKEYPFFSYFYTDSMRMTPDEWLMITQLLTQLRSELKRYDDGPQLRRIASHYIKLILQYCHRIYSRQQAEYGTDKTDFLKRFRDALESYYAKNLQNDLGLPTVAWCAKQFSITPGHFGDVIRKQTGSTAISYIHAYIIQKGKSLMLKGNNVYETSVLLGFEYPNHFSRLFKKMEGITPSEFLKG